MMNPSAWGLKGYTGFFWGSFALAVFIWAYFRLPETKDRTFHELDILFAKRTPARKFASTRVDAFDEAEADQLATRYSVAGQPPSRPSVLPSITNTLANHGRAPDAASQRRASVVAQQEHTARRPSIAPAVTEYLQKQQR
jgi:Sugar (and other) transporter